MHVPWLCDCHIINKKGRSPQSIMVMLLWSPSLDLLSFNWSHGGFNSSQTAPAGHRQGLPSLQASCLSVVPRQQRGRTKSSRPARWCSSPRPGSWLSDCVDTHFLLQKMVSSEKKDETKTKEILGCCWVMLCHVDWCCLMLIAGGRLVIQLSDKNKRLGWKGTHTHQKRHPMHISNQPGNPLSFQQTGSTPLSAPHYRMQVLGRWVRWWNSRSSNRSEVMPGWSLNRSSGLDPLSLLC